MKLVVSPVLKELSSTMVVSCTNCNRMYEVTALDIQLLDVSETFGITCPFCGKYISEIKPSTRVLQQFKDLKYKRFLRQ